MAAQSKATLKGYFNTDDQPTEANFTDLVDSVPNLTDDTVTGTGALVKATLPTLAGLVINADKVNIVTAKTPASAAAAGNAGDVCWDAAYLYVCISSGVWRRIAHATW